MRRMPGTTQAKITRHGITLLVVGLVFLIRRPIEASVGVGASPNLYLPVVTIIAWYGGFGAGVAAVVMWGLLWVYFEIPPFGSIGIQSPTDQFRVVVFLGEGFLLALIIAMLHAARRSSVENAREAEHYRMASGRNEVQLRESEERFRRERDFAEGLIDTAQVVVLVLDATGRVVRVNRFLEQIAGHHPDGVRRLDWFAHFVPNRDQPRARDAFRNALIRVEGSQISHAVQTLDGGEREVEWAYRLLPDDNSAGGIDDSGRILAIGHDITALKEAQRRALQAERLAAIGQMVTGLAHESRNALQRSQACLEMLQFRLEDRPEALDLVAGIQDAQDDLQRHYEEVRCYAAPIHLDRRPCDLPSILREAWEHLEWTRRGRDASLAEVGPAPYEFIGDRSRLIQVFRNIMDNALAACPDPVHVEASWSEVIGGEYPSTQMAIRDNGPGLHPEQRRNLFEPFFTTKTQGTGLGLAIARRIIEAHGGTIHLGLDCSAGAEIVITLPRSAPC